MPQFNINVEGWVADMRQMIGGQRLVRDRSMLEGGFDVVRNVQGEATLTGIPEVMANWARIDNALREEAVAELREACDLVQLLSWYEVPYKSGALQASFQRDEEEVEMDVEGQKPIRIYMGYPTEEGKGAAVGSDGESYAWRQHEDPELEHPTPGTKFHYLSDPFNEVAELYPDKLRERLKPVVESGGNMPGLGKGTGGPRLVKKAK